MMSGVAMSIVVPAGQPGIGLSTVVTSCGLGLLSFCVQVGRGLAKGSLRVQSGRAAAIGDRDLFFPCWCAKMQRMTLSLLLTMAAASPLQADTPAATAPSAPSSRLAVVGQQMVDFHSRALPFESPEWWLSSRVPTLNGKLPENPRPVWIQFGFKGCKPCEALAVVAIRELPDAEKVYIHLDNIMLGTPEFPNKPTLWRALVGYAAAPPYDHFTLLYGNGEPLLQAMCGEKAGIPSAILIGADGKVVSVLNTPSESAAVAAMALVKAP